MKQLGQVFRFFREARHISLSEATGGEFSKSMLSRFENGQSELSAQKLFSALSAIHTETEEFTVAAGIQDHHSHKELLSHIQDLLQANQHDLLEELYLEKKKISQNSKEANDWVERLIVKAYLCALKESEKASPDELDFLHDYLFSVDIWGRYELKLFSICTPVLSLDLFSQYTKEILSRNDFTALFTNNRNTLHTTFLNGYLLAISQENIAHADYFQQVIERHFYEENETYFRIVYLFAQGELACLKGQKKEGLAQMEKAVDIFHILDCQYSADYYQEALEVALQKYSK